jgi:hypothetical protein
MNAAACESLTGEMVFHDIESCGDHPPSLTVDEVRGCVTLLAYGTCYCHADTPKRGQYLSCESWCDTSSMALVRLLDGRHAVFRESSDTTGHGCQCAGTALVFASLDAAKSDLTPEERALLTATP